MLFSVPITLTILLIAFAINRSSASKNEKYNINANTVALSIVFFIFWTVLCFIFPNIKLGWSITTNGLVLSLIATLVLVFAHLILYHFQTKSLDYQKFKEKNLIQDGCPYDGKLSILKNFLTHGGQVLWEEILFRGMITMVLYSVFGLTVSILVPSVLFGLMHYLPFLSYAKKHNIAPGFYIWGAFIEPFIFPMVFAYSNFAINSLIPGWVMHWGLNCSVGLYIRYLEPRMLKVRQFT